jgi:CheY-like chemotaxis protein
MISKNCVDKISIIIVDDDPDDHFTLSTAITCEYPSAEILSFYNGQQVIDYFLQRNIIKNELFKEPNIFVLDINMPLKNGFETLEELKELPFVESQFVMLSTSTNKKDKERAFKNGADGFYTKPNSIDGLKGIVTEIVSKMQIKIA